MATNITYYSDASQKQREALQDRISMLLGGNQSSLVGELLGQNVIPGISWEECTNLWPQEEQMEATLTGPVPDPTADVDVSEYASAEDFIAAATSPDDYWYNLELELNGAYEKVTLAGEFDLDVYNEDIKAGESVVHAAMNAARGEYEAGEIEEYLQYVVENAEPAEVFEWYFLTETTATRWLKQHGEVVLETDYGSWWGRGCTGQAIILDPTFWEIFSGYVDRIEE